MHIPKRSFYFFNVICADLALLLCSGCINLPASFFITSVAYEPARSTVQIDASAAVEAVDTMTPEMRALWKRALNNDATIANYLSAAAQALRNDLATSGLFARIVTDDPTKADYLVKVHCEESYPSDFRARVTLTATETATGTQVSSHAREVSFGTSLVNWRWKDALPGLMAALKADLAADLVADLRAKARRQQEQVARAEAELFTKASLSDLLASSDKTEFLARERNRAIIAAKNQQLPAILREKKTDELSALVVKIEQTILDLNHESEVAKDRAQQATATNSDARQIEELRGLAISYRERIELLKPILTTFKEEIANRNR